MTYSDSVYRVHVYSPKGRLEYVIVPLNNVGHNYIISRRCRLHAKDGRLVVTRSKVCI